MTASQLPIPEANVAKKRSRKRPSSRRPNWRRRSRARTAAKPNYPPEPRATRAAANHADSAHTVQQTVRYERPMAWRTYTPDGRTLDVDYEDGTWVASCDDRPRRGQDGGRGDRAVARRGDHADRRLAAHLDEWVVQQAARLELELDDELDPDDEYADLRRAASTRPSAAARQLDLLGRADGDADRGRRAEAVQRPHDHALAQQPRRTAGRRPRRGRRRRSSRRRRPPASGRAPRACARSSARPSALSALRRAISAVSAMLASAATWAVVLTSNGRRTFAIAAHTSRGPTA